MNLQSDSPLPATPGVATAPPPPPPPPPRPPPPPAPAPPAAQETAPVDPESHPIVQQSTTSSAPTPSAPTPPKPSVMAPIRTPPSFSWVAPHPQFVIVLVGPEETPFSIQKDFLCAQSPYYREYFSKQADVVEAIVKLPDTSVEVFGLAQHFMYTGAVCPDDTDMPSYEVLVSVWKLGHELRIEGLCDRTLQTMVEVRQATERIPGAPLLMQVWRDAPEGSAIRDLLLTWAAEYVRSSESNAEFAKSLSQEVLSELVLAMSRPDTTPLVQLGADERAPASAPAPLRRKTVHYLDEDEQDGLEEAYEPDKKQRRLDPFVNAPVPKAVARKPKPATAAKTVPRRRSNAVGNGDTMEFSEKQKLDFCHDLLGRMLSGPGFWTRLVGPFREPVDPIKDGMPDYHEKITTPMCLMTMKGKMDRNEYTSHEEFLADMNLIFNNCKTYWKPTDGIVAACEKLEKTFVDKWNGRNKWMAKLQGIEDH